MGEVEVRWKRSKGDRVCSKKKEAEMQECERCGPDGASWARSCTTESEKKVEDLCIKLHRSEGRQRSEFCLESAACEGEGGVADGAAPVALDGVGGSPSASQNEGEGVSEVAELVEKDGKADKVVAEGHGGELEAVEVRGAVSRLHEEVEEVAFGGTLKAAWCVVVELAGADLGVGEEGVAHPGEVDADVGRLGEGEEDGGEVDEEVLVGEVDADGDGLGVPDGRGGGASGDAEADMGVEAGE